MKTVFFLLALWAPVWVCGQTVDGKRIDQDTTIRYVKVSVVDAGKFGKELFRVAVDYGQPRVSGNKYTILDEKGETRLWVSDMEVANYFAGFGWALLYSQRLPIGTSTLLADNLVFERRD